MSRYLVKVAYLGHAYKGWEKQPTLTTVQGTLEKALSYYWSEEILIQGAGRTDAGVNATGQTFTFDTEKPLPSRKGFVNAMSRLLPSDILVLSIQKVPSSFHARHSATGKRYRYAFRLGKKHPLEAATVAQIGDYAFDRAAFLACLRLYEGEHNFQDFTTKDEDPYGFVRTIRSIHTNLEKYPNAKKIVVTFEGNGFMTYQIRLMMGVAFKAGFHKMSLEEIKAHLDSMTRKIINYKAPPEGLTLERVFYD